jgi:hypothetical protein
MALDDGDSPGLGSIAQKEGLCCHSAETQEGETHDSPAPERGQSPPARPWFHSQGRGHAVHRHPACFPIRVPRRNRHEICLKP